jgi:N-formylglutamate amidohydrolase
MNTIGSTRFAHGLHMYRLALAALFALAPVLRSQDPPVKPEDVVAVQKGDVPIIISAPHGGRRMLPGVSERRGAGVPMFVTIRDENTLELAEQFAAKLEKKIGKPYFVIARFDRKFVDVNRPPEGGYESDQAKPYYDSYHKALVTATAEVKKNWGRGLLLDLHGQATDLDAIYRGTADGKSVKALVDRFGKAALTGDKSVFGQLAKQGTKVIPANDSTNNEDRFFSGGHIIRTYGSHDGNAIDALQLELGGRLRLKRNLDDTSEKLAEAVRVFAEEYLPAEKVKPKK